MAQKAKAGLDEVQAAIHDRDYYVAAVMLRSALLKDPNNQSAKNHLADISVHIPGALISKDCNIALAVYCSPYYYIFSTGEARAIDKWPNFSYDSINGVSWDGRFAFLCLGCSHTGGHTLEFETGALSKIDVRKYGDGSGDISLSPYGNKLLVNSYYNTNPYFIDLSSNSRTKLCGVGYWSGRKTMVQHTKDDRINIVDTDTGQCRSVQLPGISSSNKIIPSPGNNALYIVSNEAVLVSDIDGHNIKKLVEFKPGVRVDAYTPLISKDGGAMVVVTENQTIVFSLKTRRSAMLETIPRGSFRTIAWPDTAPAEPRSQQWQLIVTPASGPRGTRFAFGFSGGPPGQPAAWSIRDSARVVAGGEASLGPDGGLNDSGQVDGFGMTAGVNSRSGTHTVEISVAGQTVTSSFVITD